ncbi:restriction endonuclease subunit S [Flavobacterium reichenbachii]|uniref:restriction endonuclease subunit S n=1 Tax=Flavobacterium reichenbachii TaxID=362418 RepID=UPI00068EC1EC|nr:restriction endonuclease subunit S [Flavobacterium reichenbachii]OXB17472.1 hypothetical protein B0A68_04020 [Flavobacterium reichenbachii]
MIDKQNRPILGFPEFKEEWKNKKLKEVAKIGRGKSKHRPRDAEFLYGGKYPFIQTGDIRKTELYLTSFTQTYSEDGLKQSKLWDEDTLCITIAANIAETAILKIKACFPDSIIGLIPKENETTVLFVKHLFDKFKIQIQSLSQGAAQDNLNQEKLSNIDFTFPTIIEQQKIATFLTAVDEKIQALKHKKNLLKQYKKGVMQKIFSQELRFKDDSGNYFSDWEENKLGEVLKKNSKKNKNQEFKLVQSVSNKHGFVNQDEYFEDRIIASKDLSNYYVIQKGDFAYNPSRIDVGSLAYKFDNKTSVISPLYISFKTDKNYLNDNFLLEWFFTEKFTRQMNSSFEGSVRNTLSYESLTKIKIEFPSLEEQTKITNFLSAIDSKINHCQSQIKKTEVWKKGLLQQMFV